MGNNLKVERSVINIGIEKPIRFLHISDAHIDIDKEKGIFENVEKFEAALSYAEEKDLFILSTGDNFNYATKDNIDYKKEKVSEERNIFIPGNHDFCLRPETTAEGEPIDSYKLWQSQYKYNIYFDSVVIGGVNFVLMQNSYYEITPEQIDMLKKEAGKGYPIILCMHIPLFMKEKADEMMSTWAPCAYMIDPPEEYYTKYYDHYRRDQAPTEQTKKVVEYIKNETAIKAIIAGHIHESFDGFADCGVRQICTAPVHDGVVREIEII